MKTILSIALLIFIGYVTDLVLVWPLNLPGIPGALIAGEREKRTKVLYILGCALATLGQSYVYLAYVSFIVTWTTKQHASFIIWPFAFLAAILPIFMNRTRASVEAKQGGYMNAQVEALSYTVILSLFGFFVFVFAPSAMKFLYGWIPYISS